MLACAGYLAERVGGSDDRAEAIAVVVHGYLTRGEVDLAAELANSLDDPFVRDRLLIAVAAKCAALDDDEYAIQLAEAVEEPGLKSQAMEAVALAKAAKGDTGNAREIAAAVFHPDNALAGIALKQAERGDEAGALDTIAEIDYAGSAAMAMQGLAAIRLKKEEHEPAAELLETAALLVEEIEHDEEKIRSLADIGNAFVDARRKDRAIETLDKARGFAEVLDNVHRDNLLAAISQGFMHAGSEDLADRTLDLVADKTQIATALLGFARDYWRRDDRDEALEALDEAYEVLRSQRDTETRDSKAKFALFGSIAAQYAGFERGERAIEIAEGIEDDDQSMAALSQIAQIMTMQKRDEIGRQALNAIPEDASRMLTLVGMSDVAAKNGEKEKALSLLDEAMEVAETVPQISSRSEAYSAAALRYFDLGTSERARSALAADLKAIAEIRGDVSRVSALARHGELAERLGPDGGEDLQMTLRGFIQGTQV